MTIVIQYRQYFWHSFIKSLILLDLINWLLFNQFNKNDIFKGFYTYTQCLYTELSTASVEKQNSYAIALLICVLARIYFKYAF